MKALTLHQPYATLIAHGAKTIETRGYAPPHQLVGSRIAIHAGKTLAEGWAPSRDLPMGAVVATAQIVESFQVLGYLAHDEAAKTRLLHVSVPRPGHPRYECQIAVRDNEWNLGNYAPGRWCWALAHVRKLAPPVPARGHQKLWDWLPPPNAKL